MDLGLNYGGDVDGSNNDWDLNAVVRSGPVVALPLPPPQEEVMDLEAPAAFGDNTGFDDDFLAQILLDAAQFAEPEAELPPPQEEPATTIKKPRASLKRKPSSGGAGSSRTKGRCLIKKNVTRATVPTARLAASNEWAWRQYGQKPVKGPPPCLRSYYRCSSDKACNARRVVDCYVHDPDHLIVAYIGDHCHDAPDNGQAAAEGPLRGRRRVRSAGPPRPAAVLDDDEAVNAIVAPADVGSEPHGAPAPVTAGGVKIIETGEGGATAGGSGHAPVVNVVSDAEWDAAGAAWAATWR